MSLKSLKKGSGEKIEALIIFVDIRGFTAWSTANEVFEYSPELVHEFNESIQLKINFNPDEYFFKNLGDGVLLIKEISFSSYTKIKNEMNAILNKIDRVNQKFSQICESFEIEHGHETPLRLGWGITRGAINKIHLTENSDDYLGSNINKASRLCDLARPFGIVLDKVDFKEKPEHKAFEFIDQIRKIQSIEQKVPVWVTKEIASSFYRRELLKESPEVHVAGVCFRERGDDDYEVLLAKRNNDRQLYPGKYEGCGGQLAAAETFAQGVVRHYRSEMNITVEVFEDIHTFYEIKEPLAPLIPGLKFLCKIVEGTPNSQNHSEIRWVPLPELDNIPDADFVPGHKETFKRFLEQYSRGKIRLM